MKLLFENLAEKHFTKGRTRKFKNWIENADKARKTKSLGKKANQYDKAEELITFHAFAPLGLRKDRKEIVQEILRLANVHESVKGKITLSFEKQFRPPKGYLIWLANEVNKHPIRYIREQGKDRIKRGKPLETNTHVDAVIKTENLLILVEMKFTSDISTQTTFGSNRNQLARTIDVGISEAKKKGKKLVVLLCSPSEFYHKKSRFYYYKMQEYSDFHRIEQDICWRELEEIEECLLATTWIPLEKVIKVTYRNFSFSELEEAKRFFKERNLVQM